MITVLYVCGIIFAFCVYRGSQIRNTEGQLAGPSVCASAFSRISFIDPIIPMPAPANAHFCISCHPFLLCRGIRNAAAVFPAFDQILHRQFDPGSVIPAPIARSFYLYIFRRKC